MNAHTNHNQHVSDTKSHIELISHHEFAQVLKVAGFSQADFARSIRKSRSHVNNVANGITPITLRHVAELEQFLGSRLYRTALAVVQKQLAESLVRRQEEQLRKQEEYRRSQEETARAEQARRERRAEELAAQLDTMEQSTEEPAVVAPAVQAVDGDSCGEKEEGLV